jgi:hypothetical protein
MHNSSIINGLSSRHLPLLLKGNSAGLWHLLAANPVDLLDELVDLASYFLLVLLLVDIIDFGVDGDDRDGVDALQPLLMPFVHLPQVFQSDTLLSLSSSLLYAFQAQFR